MNIISLIFAYCLLFKHGLFLSFLSVLQISNFKFFNRVIPSQNRCQVKQLYSCTFKQFTVLPPTRKGLSSNFLLFFTVARSRNHLAIFDCQYKLPPHSYLLYCRLGAKHEPGLTLYQLSDPAEATHQYQTIAITQFVTDGQKVTTIGNCNYAPCHSHSGVASQAVAFRALNDLQA